MKKIILTTLLAVILTAGLCNFAQAENEYLISESAVFPYVEIQFVSFACGDGEIKISMKTGEAEFINCDPSEASKNIWKGLKPYFEGYKKSICKD
jgi:hypothetical protein